MMSDDENNTPKKIVFRNTETSEEIYLRKTATEQKGQRTVADKDGTQRKHKPANTVSVGTRSYSPMGTVSVKGHRNVNITVTSEEVSDKLVEVNLDRSDINLEYENEGLSVLVRRESEPSKHGIDGGHITRLTVTEGELGKEEIVAHFNNGEWDKEADTFLEKQVVIEAIELDNGIEKADIERPKPPSKEHDMDI